MQLLDLTETLRRFADERDWNQFHTPKNLAMALGGEMGELFAEMQWLSDDQLLALSATEREPIAQEMADILIYLVRLADVLNVDLAQATASKIEANRQRYTIAKSAGNARKIGHD